MELRIGTDRIALPLAARGVEVHGIDASEAMLNKLLQKPGGAATPVTLGDFVEMEAEGKFSLIYVVFNTFFCPINAGSPGVRCFANVAGYLANDGVFMIEAFVPDLARFERGRSMRAGVVETHLVSIELSLHGPVAQTVTTSHLYVAENGVRIYPVKMRYVWPSELDLMARLAGLKLRYRSSDWRGSPITSESPNHVSVYELQFGLDSPQGVSKSQAATKQSESTSGRRSRIV